jgi:hypothetical protein
MPDSPYAALSKQYERLSELVANTATARVRCEQIRSNPEHIPEQMMQAAQQHRALVTEASDLLLRIIEDHAEILRAPKSADTTPGEEVNT